jgi:hypothetical protein
MSGISRNHRIGSRLKQIAASWRRQSGGRHALLVWLTLAALFLQSLVVQTHLHSPSGSLPTSARSQAVFAGVTVERSAPLGHSSCPLCVELKAAGHYLPPTPIVLIAPPVFAFWFDRTVAADPAGPQPSHHWQSRAPPSQP